MKHVSMHHALLKGETDDLKAVKFSLQPILVGNRLSEGFYYLNFLWSENSHWEVLDLDRPEYE